MIFEGVRICLGVHHYNSSSMLDTKLQIERINKLLYANSGSSVSKYHA